MNIEEFKEFMKYMFDFALIYICCIPFIFIILGAIYGFGKLCHYLLG